MKWYHYIACIFAGIFIANAVPHFVHGISGDSFPSPFASPPGKGLSSPTVNVLWGLVNLFIGYILLRVGKVTPAKRLSMLAFFAGVVFISINLSIVFVEKVHFSSSTTTVSPKETKSVLGEDGMRKETELSKTKKEEEAQKLAVDALCKKGVTLAKSIDLSQAFDKVLNVDLDKEGGIFYITPNKHVKPEDVYRDWIAATNQWVDSEILQPLKSKYQDSPKILSVYMERTVQLANDKFDAPSLKLSMTFGNPNEIKSNLGDKIITVGEPVSYDVGDVHISVKTIKVDETHVAYKYDVPKKRKDGTEARFHLLIQE